MKQTALHWSCKRNYLKISKLLINNYAFINATDIFNKTPLFIAAQNGNLKILKVK